MLPVIKKTLPNCLHLLLTSGKSGVKAKFGYWFEKRLPVLLGTYSPLCGRTYRHRFIFLIFIAAKQAHLYKLDEIIAYPCLKEKLRALF